MTDKSGSAFPRDEEHFVSIIEKWKAFWMNQTQNSEADRANYFRRAFGVDANMKYHLARLLVEDHKALLAELERDGK